MIFSPVHHNPYSPSRMYIGVRVKRGHFENGGRMRALVRQSDGVDEMLTPQRGPLRQSRNANRFTKFGNAIDLAFTTQVVAPGAQRGTTDFQRLLPRHDEREPSRFEYEDPIPGGWARHIEP